MRWRPCESRAPGSWAWGLQACLAGDITHVQGLRWADNTPRAAGMR